MSIKKFIKKVEATLGLTDYEAENKKKALKDLLKKLNNRKKNIKKSLKKEIKKKEKKELEEEFEIVRCQIKKGKKILKELYS
jgi:gamma-glutamyl phosphate reductase